MTKPVVIVSILLLLCIGCELDGVKSANELEKDEVFYDTSTIETADTSKPIEQEKITPLLEDSLAGTPNEMVYQAENGLRVEWTKKNINAPIKLNDVVMINYDARVAAGEHYDSNKELGKPVPIKTNIGMIVPGFEEGLLQMNVGDEGRIMIPAALGYGENGYLTIVPPDADLIIDIEIVERIEPIMLDEGVKVYKWQKNEVQPIAQKNQLITFDYFAYTMGKNGYLYDNSYQDQAPFSFKLENDNVIDGLHHGMSVLREGENAFIEIPAHLAYGKKGLQDLVPKNTPIVYDVRISNID